MLLQRHSFLTHCIAIVLPIIDLQITGIREEPDLLKTKSIVSFQPHTDGTKRVLGVFTGQGAQWPQMVCTLLLTAQRPRSGWTKRGGSLAELPVALRPSFSLQEELACISDSPQAA